MGPDGLFGVPTHVVGRVVDLAPPVGHGLSDLQAQEPGQRFTVVEHHLSETMQHRRPLTRARERPVVRSGGRGIQCRDRILRAAVSDPGNDLLGRGVPHGERAAPGRRPPTIGQEAARDHVQDN